LGSDGEGSFDGALVHRLVKTNGNRAIEQDIFAGGRAAVEHLGCQSMSSGLI
jgi:hypothetical protein